MGRTAITGSIKQQYCRLIFTFFSFAVDSIDVESWLHPSQRCRQQSGNTSKRRATSHSHKYQTIKNSYPRWRWHARSRLLLADRRSSTVLHSQRWWADTMATHLIHADSTVTTQRRISNLKPTIQCLKCNEMDTIFFTTHMSSVSVQSLPSYSFDTRMLNKVAFRF